MKALAIILVVSAILFFAGGGIATWQGVLNVNTYALIGGIVGSVASTIGLLAFASPRLTDSDVLSVESKLVQRLAETTASLNEYEGKISENKEELEQLQRDRLEIELLVRQASVKVFLEEKLRRLSDEIEERVGADKTLLNWLTEYERTKASVTEIDAKITESERAELIREVIGQFEQSQRKLYLNFGGARIDVSPALRLTEQLVTSVADGFLIGRR